MKLKDVIQEINDLGWLIGNLYQMREDLWRANLYKAGKKEAHAEGFTAFAEAPSAFKALLRSLEQAEDIEDKHAAKKKEKGGGLKRYTGRR